MNEKLKYAYTELKEVEHCLLVKYTGDWATVKLRDIVMLLLKEVLGHSPEEFDIVSTTQQCIKEGNTLPDYFVKNCADMFKGGLSRYETVADMYIVRDLFDFVWATKVHDVSTQFEDLIPNCYTQGVTELADISEHILNSDDSKDKYTARAIACIYNGMRNFKEAEDGLLEDKSEGSIKARGKLLMKAMSYFMKAKGYAGEVTLHTVDVWQQVNELLDAGCSVPGNLARDSRYYKETSEGRSDVIALHSVVTRVFDEVWGYYSDKFISYLESLDPKRMNKFVLPEVLLERYSELLPDVTDPGVEVHYA
jgi:hypothetical protein